VRWVLFDPRMHEPLVEGVWRAADVEAEIRTIAREAEAALPAGQWWPVHPLDVEEGDPAVWHGLYMGAAGVVWALDYLARVGLHEPRLEHAALGGRVLESYLDQPEFDYARASLKLFTRTGDEIWLERARRFALHASAQVTTTRRQHGRGRYSLWTGDLGTAVYLHQCLAGTSEMPTIDTL